MEFNEKKYKHTRIKLLVYKAQSILEFVLIFPLLFFMILGVLELAMMWHQYYAMEMVAQEINANIALYENYNLDNMSKFTNILEKKASHLYLSELTFPATAKACSTSNCFILESSQKLNGKPYLSVKIDHSTTVPTVSLKSLHKLIFFAASLPNFKDGTRIELIPSFVEFVSTKNATARKF